MPTSGKPTLLPTNPLERGANCVYVQHAILVLAPYQTIQRAVGVGVDGVGPRRTAHGIRPAPPPPPILPHPPALPIHPPPEPLMHLAALPPPPPSLPFLARSPLAAAHPIELEHAVTEALSTCFLEIDTLPCLATRPLSTSVSSDRIAIVLAWISGVRVGLGCPGAHALTISFPR